MYTNVHQSRHFEVINPTVDGYEFNWTYEGVSVSSLQSGSFMCLTPKGFIEAGRKFEVGITHHAGV